MDPIEKKKEMLLTRMEFLIIPNIGFASFMFDALDHDNDEQVLYLYEFHIQDSWQGQGYGTRLMARLKTLDKSKRIVLTVSKSNSSAAKFYRNQGFKLDETCPSKYGIDDVDYWIYSFAHHS